MHVQKRTLQTMEQQLCINAVWCSASRERCVQFGQRLARCSALPGTRASTVKYVYYRH